MRVHDNSSAPGLGQWQTSGLLYVGLLSLSNTHLEIEISRSMQRELRLIDDLTGSSGRFLPIGVDRHVARGSQPMLNPPLFGAGPKSVHGPEPGVCRAEIDVD
jgi:hypothetical protein